MMKKLTILLFINLLCIGLYARELKVLAIGNSFSEDAVQQNLYELAAASGDTLIIGNMYIGGCSLETHYKNSVKDTATYSYRKIVKGKKTVTAPFRLSAAIEDENWDVITFQQASPLSGMYETYFPYLTDLIRYVRAHATNKQVKLGFHVTWAYASNSTHAGFANYDRDQMKMYHAIVKAAFKAVKKTRLDFAIPTGTAIQNGRTSSIGDHFCRDGYHLELNYGRYTAACTWFEILLGKSVVGNTYIPETVTAAQAEIAQKAAHLAVLHPKKVTDMKGK